VGGAGTGESKRGKNTSSIVPGQSVAIGMPRAGANAAGKPKSSKRSKKPFYKGVASTTSKRKK
jgi:hypothetical protein